MWALAHPAHPCVLRARRLQALPAPRYVVFTSDPVNGVYWCPDCVRALPAIKRTMQEKGCSLLEVLVGERAVWKDAAHPLRCGAAFGLGPERRLVCCELGVCISLTQP